MTSKSQKPYELIVKKFGDHFSNPELLKNARIRFEQEIPNDIQTHINAILSTTSLSYRDAIIIQLSYALASDNKIDLRIPQPGGRTLARKLGTFLSENHINAVADAFQNIGKNVKNLIRGNVEEYDAFLEWSSLPERKTDELEIIFEYACGVIAATARPVLPFPELNIIKLTFGVVGKLLNELLSIPSQGAYQQFVVAALLHAVWDQTKSVGYISTKNLNASDKSSRTAGDVQISIGKQLIDAYEVTANSYESKLDGVSSTIKINNLSRLNIVADAPTVKQAEIFEKLSKMQDDVAVIDINAFITAALSMLTRVHRAVALKNLYDYLNGYQPDMDKVNKYVGLLQQHGLVLIST